MPYTPNNTPSLRDLLRPAGVPAMFPGRCPACSEDIMPGELITSTIGGTWLHTACMVDYVPPTPLAIGAQCPRCFLTMAVDGSHDCEADR